MDGRPRIHKSRIINPSNNLREIICKNCEFILENEGYLCRQCNNKFCTECFMSNKKGTCLKCRNSPLIIYKSSFIESKALLIRCKNFENGCPQLNSINQLESHENICNYLSSKGNNGNHLDESYNNQQIQDAAEFIQNMSINEDKGISLENRSNASDANDTSYREDKVNIIEEIRKLNDIINNDKVGLWQQKKEKDEIEKKFNTIETSFTLFKNQLNSLEDKYNKLLSVYKINNQEESEIKDGQHINRNVDFSQIIQKYSPKIKNCHPKVLSRGNNDFPANQDSTLNNPLDVGNEYPNSDVQISENVEQSYSIIYDFEKRSDHKSANLPEAKEFEKKSEQKNDTIRRFKTDSIKEGKNNNNYITSKILSNVNTPSRINHFQFPNASPISPNFHDEIRGSNLNRNLIINSNRNSNQKISTIYTIAPSVVSELNNSPNERHNFLFYSSLESKNENIKIILHLNNLNVNQVYKPLLYQSNSLPDAEFFNSKIFCCGGKWNAKFLADCVIYDLINHKIDNSTKLKEAKECSSLVSTKNEIYCIGGLNGFYCLSTTEHFNIKNYKWEISYACLNHPDMCLTTFYSSLHSIFCLGGFNGKQFEKLDLNGKRNWEIIKFNNETEIDKRVNGCALEINNHSILIIGGKTASQLINLINLKQYEVRTLEIEDTTINDYRFEGSKPIILENHAWVIGRNISSRSLFTIDLTTFNYERLSFDF